MNTHYAGVYLVVPKPTDETLKLGLPQGVVDNDGSKGGFLVQQTDGVLFMSLRSHAHVSACSLRFAVSMCWRGLNVAQAMVTTCS
jgi:hypothetical protein